MKIVNLNSVDFPFGEYFYIKNSVYPRMLIYFEEFNLIIVVCPGSKEAVTFDTFINSDYLFFKDDEHENDPDFFWCSNGKRF